MVKKNKKKKGKTKSGAASAGPVKRIYLSENYRDAVDPGEGARVRTPQCNCWRRHCGEHLPDCLYSPRLKELACARGIKLEHLVPERLAIERPTLSSDAPPTRHANNDPRRPVSPRAVRCSMTHTYRPGIHKEAQSSVADAKVLELLARYTDIIQRQRLCQTETHDAYIRRSTLLSRVGEHERALADAQRACELEPKSAVVYFRIGVSEFELGDFEAAADSFGRGLKRSPGSTDLQRAHKAALVRFVEKNSYGGSMQKSKGAAPGTTQSWR